MLQKKILLKQIYCIVSIHELLRHLDVGGKFSYEFGYSARRILVPCTVSQIFSQERKIIADCENINLVKKAKEVIKIPYAAFFSTMDFSQACVFKSRILNCFVS